MKERICSFFLGRYRKRMACNKRMNVANSLSDVRCSIMAHYVLFSETISSTLHKVQSKLCVIAHFIHLGLRYSYYLSDVNVKAKHRFDCSFWLQSNGSGGPQLFLQSMSYHMNFHNDVHPQSQQGITVYLVSLSLRHPVWVVPSASF